MKKYSISYRVGYSHPYDLGLIEANTAKEAFDKALDMYLPQLIESKKAIKLHAFYVITSGSITDNYGYSCDPYDKWMKNVSVDKRSFVLEKINHINRSK